MLIHTLRLAAALVLAATAAVAAFRASLLAGLALAGPALPAAVPAAGLFVVAVVLGTVAQVAWRRSHVTR